MVKYDVVILGGGLAGLTLAIQLKRVKSDISVCILEKRLSQAPVATHKVGESIVELGSFYLREVLDLKAYLTEQQLPKFGFRFFFNQEHGEDITRRVEVGSKFSQPIPAHQIDRGLFENELACRLHDHNVEVQMGAIVQGIELSKKGHELQFEMAGEVNRLECKWIIDSTGRRGFLKRKLGLEKSVVHDVNAVWFRLEFKIDIDEWSDDKSWRTYLEPGRRHLATNHLMGEGYWVWIIPLVGGNTSIGIVADPFYHLFDKYNTLEKALDWLSVYEPLAAKIISTHKQEVMDFKVMRHFAHDITQFYSTDRWGITGDAGAFMDPLYSSGTDFVALNNTWLTELILRDLRGEDITLRTLIYEHMHRELRAGWIKLYENMYGLFGKTQIMIMKIIWDWATYWAIPTPMFMNNGYTNIDILKGYSGSSKSLGPRFSKLNEQMQAFFLQWGKHDPIACSDHRINVFDLKFLCQFHEELAQRYAPKELILKISANMSKLEQIAAEMFRMVSAQIHGTPLNMPVDPYTMHLQDSNDTLLEKSKGKDVLAVQESIRADLAQVWLIPAETIVSNTYAW